MRVCLLVAFGGIMPAIAQPPPIKALWVVRDVLKSTTAMDQLVNDAALAKFTDVLVQVRGRGDAYYASRIVPRAEGLDTTMDPLAYLIPRLRKQGIRIHAWVNVFYIWSADKDPLNTQHVFHSNPDWSAASSSNQSMVDIGTTQLRARDVEGIFYSPSNEEYRDHFLAIVRELAVNYDLDGVHLDYVRYPGPDYDYSESSRARFMLKYHVDPLPTKYRSSWMDTRWAEFRRSEVTGLVKAVRDTIKAIHPHMLLSAAVFADVRDAKDRVMQNWTSWIEDSLIDWAMPMNYATDPGTFDARMTNARATLGDSLFSRKVIVGVALYNQSMVQALDKVRRARRLKPAGISYFSYEVLRTDRKSFMKIAQEP